MKLIQSISKDKSLLINEDAVSNFSQYDMNSQTVHKKFVGKIQLNTFAYEKEVFKIIVDRLIQSNIFHSVCTQRINHCPANGKRSTCNCDEILEFIAKEFRAEAERFAQLFVPLIIIDYHSKIRHYLICELLYFYDRLLRPRKEFFIDDVKEKALFKSYKYNENCVCQLHEILSLQNNSSKPAKHSHVSKVNNTCLHEVMKELVSHKLLPLSSKYLPLDSLRLQKVLDICNKYYLPDDMIVRILNNLRAVKYDHNQSNKETGRFSDLSVEYDLSGSYNHNNAHSDRQKTEVQSDSLMSSSARKSSVKSIVNKSQQNVVKDETNSSNQHSGIRRQQTGNLAPIYEATENGHNRSYSSMRHSRTSENDAQGYGKSTISRDPYSWKTLQNRSYLPTSQRTSLEPQISSSPRMNTLNKRSNFHWHTQGSSRMSRRPTYQRQSEAYLNYSDYREPTRSTAAWPDNVDRCEPSHVYEVMIDDECCDLDNVNTITVRDGGGNYRTYVDCDRISPGVRRQSGGGAEGLSTVRRPYKRVSFAPNADTSTGTVTRAVLCQEANSMDALLAVLDRQVDKEDSNARQCMRVSVRAEHVIRRPDCPGEPSLPKHADDCLTISSEVQAKWENLSCDEDPKPGGLSYSAPRQTSTHPSTHSRATSPLGLSVESVAELCDKAMQTEKFLFLETCTERIVLSPNGLDRRNLATSATGPLATNFRADSRKSIINNNPTTPHGCEEAGGQFYFYEDRDRRLICSPSELCVERDTQTGDFPAAPYPGSYYRPSGYLKLPDRSYLPPSVGNFYGDQWRQSEDFNSRYNVSMRDDPRFHQSTFVAPDTPAQASTSHYAPEVMTEKSRPYSLNPYSESLAPPSTGVQQNSQNHQVNYSASCRQNRGSPEDIYYVESRKWSPIIDVATYCQYSSPQPGDRHWDNNASSLRFRNSTNELDRNNSRHPLRYLNAAQRNNSNLINCDDEFIGNRRRANWRSSPNTRRCASNENLSLVKRMDLLRKNNCSRKSMKITKYVIDYPLGNVNKSRYQSFQDIDKKLNRKNRLKWNRINSTIPVISAVDKQNSISPYKKTMQRHKNKNERNPKILNKLLKSNSDLQEINPYEKSIDYLKKRRSNKLHSSHKTSKCFSNNYEINIVHSFPNITKKSELDPIETIKEKKKSKRKEISHEKLQKAIEPKFIILKYDVDKNCDSSDMKPKIYKYQPNERNFTKIKHLKIGKFKSHQIQHKNYANHSRHKLERKISEVEVDFSPI